LFFYSLNLHYLCHRKKIERRLWKYNRFRNRQVTHIINTGGRAIAGFALAWKGWRGILGIFLLRQKQQNNKKLNT